MKGFLNEILLELLRGREVKVTGDIEGEWKIIQSIDSRSEVDNWWFTLVCTDGSVIDDVTYMSELEIRDIRDYQMELPGGKS